MTSSAPLAAIVLWTALMLPPVTGIMCYSTHCPNGKSVCQENCPASFHFCAAFYNQKPSGGLEIALLGCLDDSVGEMVPANCAISSIGQGQVGCFCNTSLCNHIGVPVSNTSTTSSTMSTMSTPARVRPEKPTGLGPNTLYCRHSSDGTNVGYQVCEDDPNYRMSDPYHRGCFGSYSVEKNGTLIPLQQRCMPTWYAFCNFTGCQLSTLTYNTSIHTTFVYCCCNTNECNLDSPEFHPDHPIYPELPPHPSDQHQICQYTNCSTDPASPSHDRHCFNGFVVCSEHSAVGTGLVSNNKSHHSCVSVEEPVLKDGAVQYDKGKIILQPVYRGCLLSNTECVPGPCILERSGTNGHYTCCCQGTLCNMAAMLNTTSTPTSTSTPTPTPTTKASTLQRSDITIIVFGVIIFVCTLLVTGMILGFIVCFMYSRKLTKRISGSRNGNVTATSVTSSEYPLLRNDHLFTRCSLMERIGHGRFGKVWRGQCDADMVAVKVFPQEDYSSWESEVGMYETEHLSHPYILHYLGRDIREEYPGRSVYWIITEYHELGSLMEYLQRETLSLREFAVMCQTAAAGLAHLHLEKTINGTLKPSIAHRDLKSKNILVKKDGSCCISDLGLAVKLEPGELGTQAEYQCQVGTARYMSPEVLSGAISFNREAFLRIDMYALGLICWEIAMRTNPGESGSAGQVKGYQQPYEEFVGSNPRIEDMRVVVVDQRYRPDFPSSFYSNPQLDRIVSTIQECWDSDPDARLTAQCVQGRFTEFYNAKFQSHNDSFEWSKETGYTSNASFLQDDSNKKVSTSEYASADSPSPSSINCSSRFVMSSYSSPGTVPDFDSLQRSDTASNMRPAISSSSSTYASSEQVGSMTRLLLASRSPPMRAHHRMDLHETTV